jgi:aspartate/methionine/tyrosine aminotransferase
LVREAGVAAIPISSFLHNAKPDRLVRFAFCKKPETLDEAARRLSKLNVRK